MLSVTLSLAALAATTATAQASPQPSGFVVENSVLRRIWAVGNDSSQLPRLAQVLFDSLGPRLTASPGMTAAQNWLIATYSSWGITARKEQYGTWRGWRRGPTHIDLVAPRLRTLEGTMLAWRPPESQVSSAVSGRKVGASKRSSRPTPIARRCSTSPARTTACCTAWPTASRELSLKSPPSHKHWEKCRCSIWSAK